MDQSRCTRLIDVAWDYRQRAVKDFLGYAQVVSAPVPWLSRINPHPYGDYRNPDYNYFLYAVSVPQIDNILPTGDATAIGEPIARGKKARLHVVYESLPWDIVDDAAVQLRYAGTPDESGLERNVVKIVKPNSDYLTLASGSYRYVGLGAGTTPVAQGVGKVIVNYDIQVQWNHVPLACLGTSLYNPNLLNPPPIDTALGRVNAKTFMGCVKGTLLLMAVEIVPHRSPIGLRIFDVVYRFKKLQPLPGVTGAPPNDKPLSGHNIVLNTKENPARWREAVTDNPAPSTATNLLAQVDGKNIYDWYDFATLFRVPT